MSVKPIGDEQLAAPDREVALGGRIPEYGSEHWLAMRERMRLLEDEREIKAAFYGAMWKDWEATKEQLSMAKMVVEIVSSSLFSTDDHKDYRRLQTALANFRKVSGKCGGSLR